MRGFMSLVPIRSHAYFPEWKSAPNIPLIKRLAKRFAVHDVIKVRSHGATSRRDMLRGHVVRSESHEATKLGENKSHKRLYALGHTKRHFHATSRSVK